MKWTIAGLIVFLMFVLVPFKVQAATLTPTESNLATPINSVSPTQEITNTPTLQPTIDLSPTMGITAINEGNQDNLTIWFLAATIGLLLIIVVAQAWPKKDEEN